jgi:lipid-binding SYLF domain-containing protein
MTTSFNGKRTALAAALAVAVLGFARMSFAGSDAGLVADAKHTVATFKKTDPGLEKFFHGAAGYVVFPGVGKGGLGIGGAHGTGVLFVNDAPAGKVKLNQVTVGAQAGGQEFAEVIFIETPAGVAQLKAGNASFTAQVSAVALKSGISSNARYANGFLVITATKGGLMFEAAVGGQKFSFEALTP